MTTGSVSGGGAGTLNPGTGLDSLFALVPALAGMIAGQHLLRVMRPETFRRWFFSGLMWWTAPAPGDELP